MMWDVVILLAVVTFMAIYCLVSSLRQRGPFRTLIMTLKGVISVVTLGFFCAAKAIEISTEMLVSGSSHEEQDEDEGSGGKNPFWIYKGSANGDEHALWALNEKNRHV